MGNNVIVKHISAKHEILRAGQPGAQAQSADERKQTGRSAASHTFFPREHGATAMLLTPFAAAAVLSRTAAWQEAVCLVASAMLFAMKDPLVVLARQRWVWKQPHPETHDALRWVLTEAIVLFACGIALVWNGPLIPYTLLFLGAACFTALAVRVNVRNRQRATAFQVASAVALTSTSLLAALSAGGTIPTWCWMLWGLMAVQAAAGIFTVHSRLDLRVASRKADLDASEKAVVQRPAMIFSALLAVSGVAAMVGKSYWIGAALLLAALGFGMDLRSQRSFASLQTRLTTIGLRALSLTVVYAALVVRGLW